MEENALVITTARPAARAPASAGASFSAGRAARSRSLRRAGRMDPGDRAAGGYGATRDHLVIWNTRVIYATLSATPGPIHGEDTR